jgi:hypothetical protein
MVNKTTKKPSLTELVAKAKGEMAEHHDRIDRMEKLLQKIASLFKPSPLVFWFDKSRWDKFEDLRDAVDGDGWDDEVHPVMETDVPGWRKFYSCLQTRSEDEAPIGQTTQEFADSVVVFDAFKDQSADVVVTVQSGAFVVKTYWDEGWEISSQEYGHPKTAGALEELLKELGCVLA